MEWSSHLIAIKNILANKYPTYQSSERLIDEAALSKVLIPPHGKPIDLWHSIIKVAIEENKMVDLIQYCFKESEDIQLKQVYFEYLEAQYNSKQTYDNSTPAKILDLTCLVELVDITTARHTLTYRLSNFGDDTEEKTFYFLAKDATIDKFNLEWCKYNGEHTPQVEQKPVTKGVKLIFKYFLEGNEKLKKIQFCYTAPSFAFLYKCKETGVVSYRAELFHEFYTELIHLTVKLPPGSQIVNSLGKTFQGPNGDEIIFTESNVEKGYPVGFPVFFCNTKFV